MCPYAQMTVCYWKGKGGENAHDVSQSDTSLNENHTENSFNNVTTVVQSPTDDNDKNELWKAWTMEMLTNNGDISTSMMNEPEQMSEENKKVPICQSCTLKSFDTVPYGANN